MWNWNWNSFVIGKISNNITTDHQITETYETKKI